MSVPQKAGFISIVGKPNVGKSTLMNQLVKERLSIITSKAQTTRHRIRGIVSGEDFQMIYSDTPGIIEPQYALHQTMMGGVRKALEDADIVLLLVDAYDDNVASQITKYTQAVTAPIILTVNKIDVISKAHQLEIATCWQRHINASAVLGVSALHNRNVAQLFDVLYDRLPVHPPYYPKEDLTDKSSRFFAAEMLREKIFEYYHEEIPYSIATTITSFKEEESIIRILASIFVERDSQKGIIIGHRGSLLKKVGIAARRDMESFFGKQIFLATRVSVSKSWRREKKSLKKLGYISLMLCLILLHW